nr:unnamed protein product [Digitaria exilis]
MPHHETQNLPPPRVALVLARSQVAPPPFLPDHRRADLDVAGAEEEALCPEAEEQAQLGDVLGPLLEGQHPASLVAPLAARHVEGVGSLAVHGQPDALAGGEVGGHLAGVAPEAGPPVERRRRDGREGAQPAAAAAAAAALEAEGLEVRALLARFGVGGREEHVVAAAAEAGLGRDEDGPRLGGALGRARGVFGPHGVVDDGAAAVGGCDDLVAAGRGDQGHELDAVGVAAEAGEGVGREGKHLPGGP